jgi:hypothetical protein
MIDIITIIGIGFIGFCMGASYELFQEIKRNKIMTHSKTSDCYKSETQEPKHLD